LKGYNQCEQSLSLCLSNQINWILDHQGLYLSDACNHYRNPGLKTKRKHILLVEDNEGDIVLIKDAFDDAKILITISVVRDGQQALDFLYKRNEFKQAASPDLVVLDVNLPKINGHEVLKTIKNDPLLCLIPIVMLTTSSSPSDINNSYRNHANCYITKPVDVDDFIKVVLSIESFWLNMAQLPEN